jgi:hypothetical protein
MVSFSTKIAIITFVGLWITFNFIVFPIVPKLLLQQANPSESLSLIFNVTIVYCLIPSIIIYLVSKLIEYVVSRMTE